MTSTASVHISVMYEEVLEQLHLEAGGRYLDCTVGGAGHMLGILSQEPTSFVVGIDRDKRALERAESRLEQYAGRFSLHHLAFSALPEIRELGPFQGILADLGVSSDQLHEARGMSFREDAPLDMRMNEEDLLSADQVVNHYSPGDLMRVLGRGGVRRNLKRYVSAILSNRPFETSQELSNVIVEATPFQDRKDKHPATVVFQAIRMEVNNELREIEVLLDLVPELIAPGGRFVCISFHSLEDQTVTRRMRKWRGEGAPANWAGQIALGEPSLGKLLTPNAILPSEEEVSKNPRARSARLRVFHFHAKVLNGR